MWCVSVSTIIRLTFRNLRDKVIDEHTYDTYLSIMEDCGKEELGYINQHDLNEEDNTGLDEEEEEVST